MSATLDGSDVLPREDEKVGLVQTGLRLGFVGSMLGIASVIIPLSFGMVTLLAMELIDPLTMQFIGLVFYWLSGVSFALNAIAATLLLVAPLRSRYYTEALMYGAISILATVAFAVGSFLSLPAYFSLLTTAAVFLLIPAFYLAILRRLATAVGSSESVAAATGTLRMLLVCSIALQLSWGIMVFQMFALNAAPPELIYAPVVLQAIGIALCLIIPVRTYSVMSDVSSGLKSPAVQPASDVSGASPGFSGALSLWRVPSFIGLVIALLLTTTTCEVGKVWLQRERQREIQEFMQAANSPASEQDQALFINQRVWNIVKLPGSSAIVDAQTLEMMQQVCDRFPEGPFLNTLGVAQFRLGQHAAAIETLEKSRPLNQTPEGDHPCDLAFLAMSHKLLGNEQQAADYRTQLNTQMLNELYSSDAECQSFVQELAVTFDGAQP